MGRPKCSWSEDLEKGLQVMEVKRWRKKAVGREEWTSVTEQAKGFQNAVGSRSE
jgi:hypothetical protein